MTANAYRSQTASLGAANAANDLYCEGAAGFAVDIRGTFVGTLTFEAAYDEPSATGTYNWVTTSVVPAPVSVGGTPTTTATAAGTWVGNCAGAKRVRVRMSAYTSGSATVTLRVLDFAPLVASVDVGSLALAAGTTAIGDVGIQYRANATGAATVATVMSPATPADTSLKASAGRVVVICLQNSAAAIRSVKFFNSATAVTLGTTAATFEVDIAAGGSVQLEIPGGIAFTTGIRYAITGAKGLTDNTGALGANDVSGFIGWV